MYYIFGLGNPGLKYKNTRHNAGYQVVDILADRHGIKFKTDINLECMVGQGMINGEKVMLLKPLTYMNHSGYAVSAVVHYFDADINEVLVLYDDIDIPFGTLRIREKGGAGTHNGMRSIVEYMQTEDFTRVRMGIGKPKFGLAGHVLGKYDNDEAAEAGKMFVHAADATECIMTDGVPKAQQLYQEKPV